MLYQSAVIECEFPFVLDLFYYSKYFSSLVLKFYATVKISRFGYV